MNEIRLVFCTCPDEAVARELANGMIEQRLAACVNVLPGIRSIYRWQGAVQEDTEVLMMIKTSLDALPDLECWLADHHPYELPEIIALPLERGLPAYIEWVAGETKQ